MTETSKAQKNINYRKDIAYPALIVLLFGFLGYAVPTWLAPYSKEIMSFLNSDFSTAMLGAIAGSGAILFIEYCRRQVELLREINIAIAVLSNVIASMLAIKRQHVIPLKKKYDANAAVIKASVETKLVLPQNLEINLQSSFTNFMSPNLEIEIPLDRLKSLVSYLPSVVTVVLQSKYYLAYFNQMHKKLMDLYSSFESLEHNEVVEFCYFHKRKGRSSDTTFRDVVAGLATHTDDVLWFSNKSIELITKAGKKALPFWLSDKIVKHEIVEAYIELMPTKSPYINGGEEF